METLQDLRHQYETLKALHLNLNIERGQPGPENLALANPMLTMVDAADVVTPSGFDIRNYPGGVKGLPEMRSIAAEILGVKPEETIVGNNASLKLLSELFCLALLKGLKNSPKPWVRCNAPKIIVTVPGYDRHFTLLEELGLEPLAVPMTGSGPDMDAVERLARGSDEVKGILFVPTYSNPTGESISDEGVRRLVSMECAAQDFTIFADDAYCIHHLTESTGRPANMLREAEALGHPDRVYLFGSTSKVTFAGAGMGFLASSIINIELLTRFFSNQYICPNKVEQYRHYKFFSSYPGGIPGLMKDHARPLKPKFDVVEAILTKELGKTGLATWTKPRGGYFVSFYTALPVAARVVALMKEAGISVTPAGANYPQGKDPENSNIRIAPTRPSLGELEKAIEALALCVKLASAEYKTR